MELSYLIGEARPDLLKDETLAALFTQTASNYPDKIALRFKDENITYRRLSEWSDQIAAALQAKGIGRGTFVGVWWERGLALHAAILGIVKSGAAYVPMDKELPAERVETILKEVGALACFTSTPLNTEGLLLEIEEYRPSQGRIESLGRDSDKIARPDDLAYVLYTSGSTGTPKGIAISHRQIAHFIRAENSILHIDPTDCVYQGFSVSFDMWCEETWIGYFAGATLQVADDITSKSIDSLGNFLKNSGITVLHAVPSLLAVMDNDIPSLRMVNAGGEACTQQVVEKWAVPSVQFFNSYGPTETTVTATIARLHPGDAITIGNPLPNYSVAIVDAQLNALPLGEAGELIIAGPGVSSGYVGLPKLTKEKFLATPPNLLLLPGKTIYRTGDAATMDQKKNVFLSGRLDDQVKIRGFRVELGEIEKKLAEISGVLGAAVAVKKDALGQDHLIGYVVLSEGLCVDERLYRAALASKLPPYMVTDAVLQLEAMPRMPSGKIDRKELPLPSGFETTWSITEPKVIDITLPVSQRVLETLRFIFPGKEVDPSKDFFNDLGGHSLLAAAFVSRLRREAGMPLAALQDIYLHRPIANLIEKWGSQNTTRQRKEEKFESVPFYRHFICGCFQVVASLFIYGLFAFQIFIPYLGYYYIDQLTHKVGYSILTSLALFCLIPPLFTLFSIIAKWLIIGKIKIGEYPLWGSYYFRWWLVKTIQKLVPVQVLNGTPLYARYLRALGMDIHKDAQLGDFNFGAVDLITIGRGVSISSKSNLDNAVVENGKLKIGRIVIGDHAYVGSSAVVSSGARIERWGELKDLSHLQISKIVGVGEIWEGSPAALVARKKVAEMSPSASIPARSNRLYTTLFSLSILIFPIVILLPLLPTIIAINKLDNASNDYDFGYLVHAPGLALIYIVLFTVETIVLNRLLLKGIKPGSYSIFSLTYLRKWFSDQLMSLSLIVLHPIYATLYVSAFFRALGAKVGRDAEISTASSVTHTLLSVGDEAFVADAVILGESDVRDYRLILNTTTIGNNSFVGNSALIPQGYALESNMLIGVLSIPPETSQMNKTSIRDWFGSPAIALPQRQVSDPFPSHLTKHPSFLRKLVRGLVELIRILLPQTVIICCSIFFIAYGHDLVVDNPLWKIVVLFPAYYLFFMGVPAFLVTVLLKWVFVGKYKVQQSPLWTARVWMSEAITAIYEALAVPFLLDFLKGTPLLPFFMRLLGVKIGRRVYMNTTDVTEFDLVTIGKDAALNYDCGPQTHLFEDRVMKTGWVHIGSRTTIGSLSIVLYDSHVGDDTQIEPLSLVMKGEKLSPGTGWTGSPVRPLA